MTLSGILIGSIFVVLVWAFIVEPLGRRRRARIERRDWPQRIQLDYEIERVRDHFFDHLSPDDIAWLKEQGWKPPAEVVRHWNEVSRFRRLATMTPAEMDAFLKARAAGIHISAHPDDVAFHQGDVVDQLREQ